jgi:hypothetical protein
MISADITAKEIIILLLIILITLWVASTVYSNLQTEEEVMEGYRQDCIQEYNLTNTGLINKCAYGAKLMSTIS